MLVLWMLQWSTQQRCKSSLGWWNLIIQMNPLSPLAIRLFNTPLCLWNYFIYVYHVRKSSGKGKCPITPCVFFLSLFILMQTYRNDSVDPFLINPSLSPRWSQHGKSGNLEFQMKISKWNRYIVYLEGTDFGGWCIFATMLLWNEKNKQQN